MSSICAFVQYDFESGVSVDKYNVTSMSNNKVICEGFGFVGKLGAFKGANNFKVQFIIKSVMSSGVSFYVLASENESDELNAFISEACRRSLNGHISNCLKALTVKL